ncbi:MAG: rhomboid family intramembrane serine protease [Myxococcota bacterium]
MRVLHVFDEKSPAERLAEALEGEGIGTDVKPGREAGFQLFVQDDDDLEAAKAALALFLERPDDARFDDARKRARESRRARAKHDAAVDRKVRRARASLEASTTGQAGPMSKALVGIAAVLTAVTSLAPSSQRFFDLIDFPSLVASPYGLVSVGAWERFFGGVWELTILRGELWRLVTPFFVHAPWFSVDPDTGARSFELFGVFHLVFNGMWLLAIGGMLERERGPWRMLALWLATAWAGEILESLYFGPANGVPHAIGMSGAVYGLLGYCYVRGRYDPTARLGIPRQTMTWMIAWLVLGFAGFMRMANGAHLGGLLMGCLLGFLASGYLQRQLLRKNESA